MISAAAAIGRHLTLVAKVERTARQKIEPPPGAADARRTLSPLPDFRVNIDRSAGRECQHEGDGIANRKFPRSPKSMTWKRPGSKDTVLPAGTGMPLSIAAILAVAASSTACRC